jgi:tetratricopeptide (TPR) repeat protein
MAQKPTNNPEAYELYLKGRFFWNKRTSVDLPKAADYYKQAIAKDPHYAPAYAGLADCYVLYPDYGVGEPAEFNPKGREVAQKALSLDPSLGEPHAALGTIYTNWDREFEKAISEFERAIELNPNYATAYQWITTPLGAIGQWDRAIENDMKAIALDPLSLIVNADLAFNYFGARRFDSAVTQCRKTLEIDPGFHVARNYLGLALQFKGELTQALPELRAAAATSDEPYIRATLGQALARAGQRDEARQILAALEEESRTHFVTAYGPAVIRLALGDKEGALASLDLAIDQHAPEIVTIKSDPLLDDLRGDPRFQVLVRKVIGERK